MFRSTIMLITLAFATGCGGTDDGSDIALTGDAGDTATETTAPSTDAANASAFFPDIVAVDPTYDAVADTWSFAVTVSSPYDTPAQYADGWRVIGPDGTVYGVHTLAHDHASEQPFTRHQRGVTIPDDVDEVTIEGRDLASGFGGGTATISLQTERP